MADKYITCTQLNNYIKKIFEAEEMLQNIFVIGEVSTWSVSGPHAYFTIKDKESTLSCNFFGFGNTRGYTPKTGDQIICFGSVSYWPKGGRLSFNVTKIQNYGIGQLYEKYLLLKEQLEKEGLFAVEHKIGVPKYVHRIGVISSPTGAVIRDIINVTKRRNPYVDIVLFPVKVQGVGADIEIEHGISVMDSYKDVDVLILARGGGSLEDLEPFYTERVVRAIYNCKKPIISAVGHETDFSLADLVADLRAPTPSAAAELAVFDYYDFKESLDSYIYTFYQRTINKYQLNNNKVKLLSKSCSDIFTNYVTNTRRRIDNYLQSMYSFTYSKYQTEVGKVNAYMSSIEAKNPMNYLKKGYSFVEKDGKGLTSVKNVNVDDKLTLKLHDGEIDTKVINIKEK